MSGQDKTSGERSRNDATVVNDTRDAPTSNEPARSRRARMRRHVSNDMTSTESHMTVHDAVPGATEPPNEHDENATPAKMLAKSDRFEDLGRIGLGGMGAVHLVNDVVLLRTVAMKTLHPKLSRKHEHAERFLREVQLTGRLDHPNIVPVHDIGFHGEGNAFFIMKHVDGETLTKRIDRHREQPLAGAVLEELLHIFLKLSNAIRFAHSRGVIHRDLKPNNVMVGNHGEVYVMDWGIALLYDSPDNLSDDELVEAQNALRQPPEFDGSLLGTVGYMSPEQADGRVTDIDYRTDIFGLGAILYEILTGRSPYRSRDSRTLLKQARAGQVEHPTAVSRGRQLPPGLCDIAMKALAKDPDDRYQTVAELENAISAFWRGGGWFKSESVPAGTVIVREGDEPESAYIIDEGECEVYKTVDGERRVLRVMGQGEVFGETAIFTGKVRTASVVAKTDVKLVVITRESLDYEMSEKRWLATFVRALAERFVDLDNQLSSLDSKSD